MPPPTPVSTSGGSPFEKLATTVAPVAAFPQSSTACTSIVCGQPAGELNPPPRTRVTASNLCGLQASATPRADCVHMSPGAGDPEGATSSRTFTVCTEPSPKFKVSVAG